MEIDDIKTIWTQHEKVLVENTKMNKELLQMIESVWPVLAFAAVVTQ